MRHWWSAEEQSLLHSNYYYNQANDIAQKSPAPGRQRRKQHTSDPPGERFRFQPGRPDAVRASSRSYFPLLKADDLVAASGAACALFWPNSSLKSNVSPKVSW